MTPGAPAGTYSLSGFENVNLYSGNLNFHLPLVKVGGRGGAQTTSCLSIDSIHWRVDKTPLGDDVGNLYVRVVADLDSTRRTEARQFFDGLGRLSRQATYENSDAAHPWLTVDTAYDPLGRARKVSLPYRAAEGAAPFLTDKWTETSYDALGRVRSVTTRPDGAKATTDYSGDGVAGANAV